MKIENRQSKIGNLITVMMTLMVIFLLSSVFCPPAHATMIPPMWGHILGDPNNDRGLTDYVTAYVTAYVAAHGGGGDANVTTANVLTAIGYTPVSPNEVNGTFSKIIKTPINITVNTSLTDANWGQVFDVNGDVNLIMPPAKAGRTGGSLKARFVKGIGSLKPYSGDAIVRLTGTVLAADACSVASGGKPLVLITQYPASDDVNKNYEEANDGNFIP
jgi:hypothetical protein